MRQRKLIFCIRAVILHAKIAWESIYQNYAILILIRLVNSLLIKKIAKTRDLLCEKCQKGYNVNEVLTLCPEVEGLIRRCSFGDCPNQGVVSHQIENCMNHYCSSCLLRQPIYYSYNASLGSTKNC